MSSDTITCNSCESDIASIDELETKEAVHELDTRTFKFGPAQRDVYRCKQCGAILGVSSSSGV